MPGSSGGMTAKVLQNRSVNEATKIFFGPVVITGDLGQKNREQENGDAWSRWMRILLWVFSSLITGD